MKNVKGLVNYHHRRRRQDRADGQEKPLELYKPTWEMRAKPYSRLAEPPLSMPPLFGALSDRVSLRQRETMWKHREATRGEKHAQTENGFLISRNALFFFFLLGYHES